MQFMHTWAETCLSGAAVSPRVPVFDRTSISDPSDHYSFFYNQVQKMSKSAPKDASPASKPSELDLATFSLKQEHIQRLKQLVSAKAKQRNTTFRCSTIVVTFAYVWTCFVRAKRIDRTKRVCIGIPADYRARAQPPLPMEYFGNCVLLCMGTANAADLIEDDGVIVAAEAVGNAIDKLSEGLNMLRNLSDKNTIFNGAPMLSVAGSPKFKVYDVDFGLGRPMKVEIVSAVKTGAMSVADSRNEEGGVEIGIAFPKDEMDCFNKNFFDGLKLLSE
ncbi:phenolic glucoside malonyltransferase 1-like [Carex rostrata]